MFVRQWVWGACSLFPPPPPVNVDVDGDVGLYL